MGSYTPALVLAEPQQGSMIGQATYLKRQPPFRLSPYHPVALPKMNSLKTVILNALDNTHNLASVLNPAIQDLKDGNPVAIPTETVYGLAANALNTEACRKIYSVKNRPSDNPLIVHISNLQMLRQLVAPVKYPASKDILDQVLIPDALKPVLRRFWPGPLTVLLPKKDGVVPDVVTAGLPTVAVRFPAHPVAQKVIELCGFPLAAPSANLSGFPSPTTANHVFDDLNGRLSFIVEGGPCGFGLESTVLDCTQTPPTILRPGSITAKMLSEFLPGIQVFKKTTFNAESKEVKEMEERPSTPGMKYRHYSPVNRLILFDRSVEATSLKTEIFIREKLESGNSICRLTLSRNLGMNPPSGKYQEFPLSEDGSKEEIARNLFSMLRAADAQGPNLIVAESVEDDDEGLAIMNRLSKAASEIISA